MPLRLWPIVLPLLCLAACDCQRPADSPASAEASSRFDPAACGSVTGIVRWGGDVGSVAPFRSIDEPLTDKPQTATVRDWPNPNAPRIDPASGALAGAVVSLRGVDPQKARPWDHAPLRVELRQQTFVLRQAEGSHVGFVRAGDAVEFVSHDERLHVAQARGAAFFALTLPKPGQARTRRLEAPGVVELASGAGYFWMRAYVHVSDHPYLTRSDERGGFRLDQVPAGDYDLVVWHPDWHVSSEQRNPDLFRVQQVRFGPPLEGTQRVRVQPGRTAEVEFALGAR